MVEVVLLRTCGRNVANMEVELQDWETQQCPPLPRDSADRGGVFEENGGVRKKSTLQFCQTCRKAASRLTANLFGSVEPLPLYRRRRGDTEEDIAGSGLWLVYG